MKELAGKLAVVTGAGSGIGRALTLGLAAEGARLAIADLDADAVAETARQAGGALAATRLDVADRAEVDRFAAAVADLGGADVVINNAGISTAGRVVDLTAATLERTMAVNFWGTVYGTQAFLPQLQDRPEAALVNLSSTFAFMGVPGQSAYCASKFAVRGFTEALRHETRGTGLAVTTVFPGGVRTGIAANGRVDYPVGPDVLAEAYRDWQAQPMRSPEQAATDIIGGIHRKAARVIIGRDARLMDRLARWLPERHDRFVDRYLRRGPIWRALDAHPAP
jgi:NAD(P)-dependent dehydrogenase (short-subunit alcohol dehydrogenase family)